MCSNRSATQRFTCSPWHDRNNDNKNRTGVLQRRSFSLLILLCNIIYTYKWFDLSPCTSRPLPDVVRTPPAWQRIIHLLWLYYSGSVGLDMLCVRFGKFREGGFAEAIQRLFDPTGTGDKRCQGAVEDFLRKVWCRSSEERRTRSTDTFVSEE